MRFIKSASVAMMASAASATLSAQQVIDDINKITQVSSQTNLIARSISPLNVYDVSRVRQTPFS